MADTIDITPDRDGMLRFAQMLVRTEPKGSKSAEVGLKILAEYGVEPDES